MTHTLPVPKAIIHECPDCRSRCICETGVYEPWQCMHCLVTTDEFRSLHAKVARTKDKPEKPDCSDRGTTP